MKKPSERIGEIQLEIGARLDKTMSRPLYEDDWDRLWVPAIVRFLDECAARAEATPAHYVLTGEPIQSPSASERNDAT